MEKSSHSLRNASQTLKVAFRSLTQHKLRTGLSILGIVCGVMAVMAMIAIGEGARQKVLRQIEQLGIRNIYIRAISLTDEQRRKAGESLSSGLNLKDADRIRFGCRHVRDAACLKVLTTSPLGMAKEISPQIAAVSSTYAELLNIFVDRGRFIADQDVARGNLVCVPGSRVVESLGAEGRLGKHIRIENLMFKIVGILERFGQKREDTSVMAVRNYDEMIFIPLGTIREKRDTDELTEIVVQVRKTREVYKAEESLKRIMAVSHHHMADYQMVVPQELLRQVQKTRRMFNIVLGAIAGISLIVGGIGIMNIMLATVSERTKEIGIRRAVGATRRDIMVQFLAESLMLTFAGGVFGVMLGALTVWLISGLGRWDTAITLPAILLPLLMSALVGICFGLYPAWQAARTDPVIALGHAR